MLELTRLTDEETRRVDVGISPGAGLVVSIDDRIMEPSSWVGGHPVGVNKGITYRQTSVIVNYGNRQNKSMN